jgi:hypothetical protein
MNEQADNKKYVLRRELIRQVRARRIRSLEEDLTAAANQAVTTLDMTEVREKGLLAVLRGIRRANSKPPTLRLARSLP